MTTFSKWTSFLWNENSKLHEKSNKIHSNDSDQSVDNHSVHTGSLDSLADDSTEKSSNNATLQVTSTEKDSDSLYDSRDDLNYNDNKQPSNDETIKSDEYDSHSLLDTEQSVDDKITDSLNSSITNRQGEYINLFEEARYIGLNIIFLELVEYGLKMKKTRNNRYFFPSSIYKNYSL